MPSRWSLAWGMPRGGRTGGRRGPARGQSSGSKRVADRTMSPGKPRRISRSAALRRRARSSGAPSPYRRRTRSRALSSQSPSKLSIAAAIASLSRPWVPSSARMWIGPYPLLARLRTRPSAKRVSSCQPASASFSTAALTSSASRPRVTSLRVSSLRECSRRTSRPSARWVVLAGCRLRRRPGVATGSLPNRPPSRPSSSGRSSAIGCQRNSGIGFIAVVVLTRAGLGGHELLAQFRLEPLGDRGVLLEVLPGVLLALADPLLAHAVPGARLLHQLGLHAHVDQLALAGDALAVQDLGDDLLERRRHLVLDDLDLGLVADDLVALLDRTDAADVQAHGGVE